MTQSHDTIAWCFSWSVQTRVMAPQAQFVDESMEVPFVQERTSSLEPQTTIQKTTEISK